MAKRKGPLWQALEDFWFSSSIADWFQQRWDNMIARNDEMMEIAEFVYEESPWASIWWWASSVFMIIGYIITGWKIFGYFPMKRAGPEYALKITDEIGAFWEKAFETETIETLVDVVGGMTSEPILQLFEKLTPEDIENPRAFVRRLHGVMIGLSLGPGMLATALETLSLGQIDTPAEIAKSIYWNFGLGFLGWQSIAPMMTAGMLSVLERHYNKEFQPTRFSSAELRDLFALGEIGEERFLEGIQELGWRPEDIDMWRKLAFKTLSEGDVHEALKRGFIDQGQWAERMRALGHDPANLNILFGLNISDDVEEAKVVSLTTAKRAFREGLLGQAEFRGLLQALGKSEDEIYLLIALEMDGRESDLKILTVSQIKNAWEENVLSDPEARHWLKENDFGTEEIGIVMDTWKATAEPVFRKLNKGTIVGAYVTAVINRNEASLKLISVGFAPADARLELDLAEARAPEVFGRPEPAPSRHLTPGVLADLLATTLITPQEMYMRLMEQDYEQEDAELLVAAAIVRAEEMDVPLTQLTVERAYIVGVLDRTRSSEKLAEMDFDEDEINIILDTVEQENLAVFFPESIQAVRVPTIGALVEATRVGILTELEFHARAAELGLNREGAEIYLALAIQTERKRIKGLTKSEISNLYEVQKFDYGTAMMRMMSLGYNNEDASLILWMDRPELVDHEIWKLLLNQLITPESAFAQLLAEGYSDEEIDKAIEGLVQNGQE